MMEDLIAGFCGLLIGSFLNVVIHRVPNEQSIVFPNSACPGCGTAIKGYDNIPVISWLLLRGKCRACSKPISVRYPAVELMTGVLFVLVYWSSGMTPMLPVNLAFVAAMVALIFIGATADTQVVTMRLAEIVGSRGNDWHLLTAGAFITMLLPLVVFFSLQRFFVHGLLAGSVKG